MWAYGLDWAGPGQRQVAYACECGNEPSGSVKCGEILDQLQTSQPCTMEIVRLFPDSGPKGIMYGEMLKRNETYKFQVTIHESGSVCYKIILIFSAVYHSL